LKQVKDHLSRRLTVCYTPGYLQFKALIEGVRETFLIQDVKEQRYYYCYYTDSKADKLIGYISNKSKNLDRTSSSHYLIMSLYNLPNTPCTFIRAEEDEGALTLDCERFVKHTNVVYITSGMCMFKQCASDIEGFKLSETGFDFKLISKGMNTRGVQKVLQIDIQKIHKALEFDFI